MPRTTRAWGELINALDPWGRPYRIVLGKIRVKTLPGTETMNTPNLDKILSTLFPSSREERILPDLLTIEPVPPRITDEELALAIEKMSRKNTIRGSDGVPGRVQGTILVEPREELTMFLNSKGLESGQPGPNTQI